MASQGQLSRTRPVILDRLYRDTKMIELEGTEAQMCFIGDDGFWRCNFVIKNGKEVRSKRGKWLRFPACLSTIVRKRKLPKEIEVSEDSFLKKS